MSKDDDRDPKDVWVWGLCKTGTGSWYKYPFPISPTPACSSNLEECYPFGRMYSLFHFFSVLRVGGTWNPYFQCQDTPPASEPISVSMSRLKGERNLLPCHTATAAGPAYQRRRIRVPEGQRKSGGDGDARTCILTARRRKTIWTGRPGKAFHPLPSDLLPRCQSGP